ncbi:MAG: pilus assembly protein PilM [Oscillospiraceae bacterium]|nr:pilus assembly protein PilM [Oscillospiraceae bacterium]
MVSLDITDKQIKLVRGSLAGSKIKINDVGVRDVGDGNIVNGYVTNIPAVAAEISEMLKSMKVSDKEVIVCVNSSSILYKELELLKPKTLKNTSAIEGMIVTEMGIGNDYNASYSVVGESKNANGQDTIKVMATACPQRLVDSYQALFVQLGLKLTQINISNNCITRLVMHTPKLKEVMPFLLIQVDTDFININLYENGQVALSRYVKIDPSDYDNNPDYVNIAVFDNLFRMVQFIGQRPGAQPLRQIMFYGVIRDFVALSNSIQSFNIPAVQLSMPTSIVKFCEVDFSLYANAIGAFYKIDPLMEHINLLQSKAVKSKQSANMLPVQILGVFAGSAALVFVAWFVINMQNVSLIKQHDKIQDEINAGEFDERKAEMEAAQQILDNFTDYKDAVELSQVLFDFLPRGNLPQVPEKLMAAYDDVIDDNNLEDSGYVFNNIEFSSYNLSMTVVCEHVDAPANLVEKLHKQGFFENIVYEGYEVKPASEVAQEMFVPAGLTEVVVFDLKMELKGGHIFTTDGRARKSDGMRVYYR